MSAEGGWCPTVKKPNIPLVHTYVGVAVSFYTVDAGLLARSQYSEGPATGHIDTGFSWFPCA